jgi:hypothetical protein
LPKDKEKERERVSWRERAGQAANDKVLIFDRFDVDAKRDKMLTGVPSLLKPSLAKKENFMIAATVYSTWVDEPLLPLPPPALS